MNRTVKWKSKLQGKTFMGTFAEDWEITFHRTFHFLYFLLKKECRTVVNLYEFNILIYKVFFSVFLSVTTIVLFLQYPSISDAKQHFTLKTFQWEKKKKTRNVCTFQWHLRSVSVCIKKGTADKSVSLHSASDKMGWNRQVKCFLINWLYLLPVSKDWIIPVHYSS